MAISVASDETPCFVV